MGGSSLINVAHGGASVDRFSHSGKGKKSTLLVATCTFVIFRPVSATDRVQKAEKCSCPSVCPSLVAVIGN